MRQQSGVGQCQLGHYQQQTKEAIGAPVMRGHSSTGLRRQRKISSQVPDLKVTFRQMTVMLQDKERNELEIEGSGYHASVVCLHIRQSRKYLSRVWRGSGPFP